MIIVVSIDVLGSRGTSGRSATEWKCLPLNRKNGRPGVREILYRLSSRFLRACLCAHKTFVFIYTQFSTGGIIRRVPFLSTLTEQIGHDSRSNRHTRQV
jgi:hypothetical protein